MRPSTEEEFIRKHGEPINYKGVLYFRDGSVVEGHATVEPPYQRTAVERARAAVHYHTLKAELAGGLFHDFKATLRQMGGVESRDKRFATLLDKKQIDELTRLRDQARNANAELEAAREELNQALPSYQRPATIAASGADVAARVAQNAATLDNIKI